MSHTRYTAAKRREVEAARRAAVDARFQRWADMPFDEFLPEYAEVAVVNTPDLIADARERHARRFAPA